MPDTPSAFEVHELIQADVERRSPDCPPHRVKFPAGHLIPEGVYEQNEDGIWVQLGRRDGGAR